MHQMQRVRVYGFSGWFPKPHPELRSDLSLRER